MKKLTNQEAVTLRTLVIQSFPGRDFLERLGVRVEAGNIAGKKAKGPVPGINVYLQDDIDGLRERVLEQVPRHQQDSVRFIVEQPVEETEDQATLA